MAALFRIIRHIRRIRPDIVHTHTAKAGALGRIAAIFTRVPVRVHTFHGNVFQGYFSRRKTRFILFIEKVLARFSHAIITISPSQRDDVVAKYGITNPAKCRVVKLGFDLGKLSDTNTNSEAFRKKFNFGKDDILVGIIGRLVPIKNHKMFINAAEYITKHAGHKLAEMIKFVIIGDGDQKAELRAYSKFKKLDSKIIFTGWLENMNEAYAGLDIIALTSINEGTPVSMIEAMAASKPVVATDVGGVRDAAGSACILVKNGDYEEMAKEILGLVLSEEKRKNLGRLGCERAKKHFSKERLVSELRGLYEEVLAKKYKGRKK